MGRGRARGRTGARSHQRADAAARETLEREWAERLDPDPSLLSLVTARGARQEPLHRWISYRQGFSPELARRFLADARLPEHGVVLDPFSGSGTVATEVALAGRRSLGLDAIGALAFVHSGRGGPPPGDWRPDPGADLPALLEAAPDRASRVAVILAASAGTGGEGERLDGGPSPAERVDAALEMMRRDLASTRAPLGVGLFAIADARALPLAEGSVAGVLTSPPYLSRYDYARINDPLERLWRGRGRRRNRPHQVRASRSGGRPAKAPSVHPAAAEAADRLLESGRSLEAAAVMGYVADMAQATREIARVLLPGAPVWMVVAGADVKRVYVPADLILVELLAGAGLRIEALSVARELRPSARRLGDLSGVAPREILIQARRPA
jgi:hypothetical protein